MTSPRTKPPATRLAAGKRHSVTVNEVPPKVRSKRRTVKQVLAAARARDALYRAVEAYIRLAGGSAVVVGGVEIQRWQDELKFNYRLAIRVTGVPPHYAPNAPRRSRT